jgi:hypothetical protein
MTKRQKRFDAVATMRAARDKMSAEIAGMSIEEELRWLAAQQLADPVLERLRGRAAQHALAADGAAHRG